VETLRTIRDAKGVRRLAILVASWQLSGKARAVSEDGRYMALDPAVVGLRGASNKSKSRLEAGVTK